MPAAPFAIEPLGKHHDRSRFQCGSASLDRYLQQQARQDAEKRVAAPFVALLPRGEDPRVLGYYTLSASLPPLGNLPDDITRKLPRYPQLPVTLLGRLAVDQTMKGQGLGEFLLLDALHRSLASAAQIAAMAVIVEAKDDAAAAFYRHFSFIALQANPRRLFLPMKTVAQLLG